MKGTLVSPATVAKSPSFEAGTGKTSVTEAEFHQRIDRVQQTIEAIIDAADVAIDYDTEAGVQTLSFANGAKLILSRQAPLRQLWLAARSGGFHLAWQETAQCWADSRSGETLPELLSRLCAEQGINLNFSKVGV